VEDSGEASTRSRQGAPILPGGSHGPWPGHDAEAIMTVPPHSDALVFFGATGGLAYKQIFPALQALVRRGALNGPVVAVARSDWSDEQLRARARDSIEHHGTLDRGAFDRLSSKLRFVPLDFADAGAFDALRRALGTTVRPLHYLAIPPSAFAA